VYDDDATVFAWVRQGAQGESRPLESQVMDWADDVAYSVHDVEDGIVSGLVDPRKVALDEVAAVAAEHYSSAGVWELEEIGRALVAEPWWSRAYDGTTSHQIAVKRMTSTLIGRFCSAAERATRARFGETDLCGYAADLEVPFVQRAEVALLKAITRLYVMQRPEAASLQAREREVIAELVPLVCDRVALEPFYRELWDDAPDDRARLRVAVDQVAALTDAAALRLHARLS
jgi:dGTPase